MFHVCSQVLDDRQFLNHQPEMARRLVALADMG
jgi:hypothetical protein